MQQHQNLNCFVARKLFHLFLLVLCLFIFFQNKSFAQFIDDKIPTQTLSQKASTGFIANEGQLRNDDGALAQQVLCYFQSAKLQIYLTNKGLTYVFHRSILSPKKETKDSVLKMEVELVGAAILKENIEYKNQNKTPLFFYKTKNISDQNAAIFSYKKIVVHDIYNGISWWIEWNDSSLKTSYSIAPYADLSKIKLKYNGVKTSISNNELLLQKGAFNLTEKNIFGEQDNKKIIVHWLKNDDNTLSFSSLTYNKKKPLIIDPTMVWGSVIGSPNCNNFLVASAFDKAGNFYATGYTCNSNFPIGHLPGAYSQLFGGDTDVIVCKFSPTLALKWTAYIGGSFYDLAHAVKCDANNNVFIAGKTNSTNFPLKQLGTSYTDTILNTGGINSPLNNFDAFLLKFNTSGVLQFSTFVGGSNDDFANDLEIDNSTNIFIGGGTNSYNFPLQSSSGFNQTALYGSMNGFVCKFSNAGAMLYSSYFGGNNSDVVNSISADNAGNIFMVGNSNSFASFPLVNNSTFYNAINNNDGFIAKFNTGLSLQWSTFDGGNLGNSIYSSVIDNNNNLIIAGTTNSTSLPMKHLMGSYFDSILNQNNSTVYHDVFLQKFDNNGTLLWGSFLGGSKEEDCNSIFSPDINNDLLIADKCGNFYFSFRTNSSNINLQKGNCNAYFDNNLSLQSDAFIAKFNKQCQYVWGTYFGGEGDESPLSMAIDGHSGIVGAGTMKNSFGFGVQYSGNGYNNYPQDTSHITDGYLAKFTQPNFKAAVSFEKCATGCTGAAQVVVNSTCNMGAYNYKWNNGATIASVINLCNGTYQIVVTDTLNTCLADTISFVLKNGFHAVPVVSPYSCSFRCDANASVSLPNVSGTHFYWHVNDTIYKNISSVTGLCPRRDTLITTSTTCGSDTSIFNIPPPPFLSATINSIVSGDISPCPIKCKASAQIILTGGEAQKYLCIWSSGTIGTVDSNLCPGNTYTVSVSDSTCYSTSINVTIPQPYTEEGYIHFITQNCSVAIITAGIYHAGRKIIYKWNNGKTDSTITVSGNGTYTCIVSDSCFRDTVSVTLQLSNAYPLALSVGTPLVSCDTTKCVGTINCGATGGVPPYYFYQNFNYLGVSYTGSFTLTNICGNKSYIISVQDGCGNVVNDTVFAKIISNNHFHVDASPITYTCMGTCNGSASFYHVGGNPTYTIYWWDGSTNNVKTHLCPDSVYYVIGRDGCHHYDSTPFRFPRPPNISAYLNAIGACRNSCNGSVSVNVNGGMFPFSFLWNNGSTGTVILNACYDSTYSCIITDYCGAKDTVSIKVPLADPPITFLDFTPSCRGFCNGSAYVINTSGINPPFTYLWNTGSTATIVSPACLNQKYICTTTDHCGMKTIDTVTVLKASPLNNFIGSATSCSGICNGTAYVYNSSGGIGPYTYAWNTGAVTQQILNACYDSTYRCVVTDVCGSNDTVHIKILLAPSLNGFITPSISLCNPNCSGQATLHYSGGYPPYFYRWNNNTFSLTTNNLCTDSNYYCILSTLGCGTDTFYVHMPKYVHMAATYKLQSLACFNNCNGAASVAVTGGVPPYTYQWSGGQTIANPSTLCYGINKCIITDSCGYKDSISLTISLYPKPTGVVTVLSNSCSTNICNGSAFITPSGGYSPYSFKWSNGQTLQAISNLCHGKNWCIVSDFCGRFDTVFFNMPVFSKIVSSVGSLSNTCSTNICVGSGTVSVTGGSAPYTYLWSNGQTANAATTLCHGNNFCITTDACGNKDTAKFVSPTFSAIQLTVNSIGKSCPSICTGSANAIASGGRSPYTYGWSNGKTVNPTTQLCTGKNWCIVTDACTNKDTTNFFDTALVFNPLVCFTSFRYPSCINSCTGQAVASQTGGVSPYNYSWTNGQIGKSVSNLCKGNNFLIATDFCLNKDTNYFTINNFNILSGKIDSIQSTCINVCNGYAAVSPIGGKAPYKYKWNNGITTNTNNSLCNGNNFCVITDSCAQTDTVLVNITNVTHLQLASTFQDYSKCRYPCSGYVGVVMSGGKQPYTYAWSNGATTSTITNICQGIYNVLITNNYCLNDSVRFSTIINSKDALTDYTKIYATPNCYDSCDGAVAVFTVGGFAPFTFNWTGGLTQSAYNNLCAGQYFIQVKDDSGCISLDSVLLTQPPALVVDTAFTANHCYHHDGKIIATASGGVMPYHYLWNTGSTKNYLQNIGSGNYSLLVTDSNGCAVTQQYQLIGLAPHLKISNDTLVGMGKTVNLFATGASNYVWNPTTYLSCDSCSKPLWNGLSTVNYCVIGIDKWNCADTECVTISVFDDCGEATLPTAFSPNGDGRNDNYKPLGLCIEKVDFKIYDRWGNLLFESIDPKAAWDGTFKGKPMPADVYVWQLHATYFNGRTSDKQGNVSLLR